MERYITCILRNGEIQKLKLYNPDIVSDSDITFELKEEIIKVIIPEGVTIIKEKAFINCQNLEKILLPESIEYIEDAAFYGLKKLEYINFPKDIKIGSNAFCLCESLKRVVLFNNTYLEEHAFSYSGIEELIILKNLQNTKIEEFFSKCVNLTTLVIPASLNVFYWFQYFNDNDFDIKESLLTLDNNRSITFLCNDIEELMHSLDIFIKAIGITFSDKNPERKLFLRHFTLKIQKDNLTSWEEMKINAFLWKNKIRNVSFVTMNLLEEELKLNEDSLKEHRKEPFKIEVEDIDEGNQKLLDEINTLLNNLSNDTKLTILTKMNKAISDYKENIKKEIPTLNLDNNNTFSFYNNEIGSAKLTLTIELNNIILTLSRQFKLLELLSKLDNYQKILDMPVDKSVDKEETIEDILTNITYLANQMDENNKKEILDKVGSYLNKPRNSYQKELAMDFGQPVTLSLPENIDCEQELHLNLSNYLDEVKRKSTNIIPYVTLLNCLKNNTTIDSYSDDDGVVSLINNIRYIILKLNAKDKQEEFNILFDNISKSYIKQINVILKKKDNKKEYQRLEEDLRMTIHPFLVKLNEYTIKESNQKYFFNSLITCEKLLNK